MSEELTNLNWLCSINTTKFEVHHLEDVKSSIDYNSDTSIRPLQFYGASVYKKTRSNEHLRPLCSYSCLIAMALKACTSGCLPVHEIYRFIEQEYPFYKTAPEGWKNSIRHNLSMNQNFIKVNRPDGFQTKKGFYWAMNPSRVHILELEIEKALKVMGRKLIENNTKGMKKRETTPSLHSQRKCMKRSCNDDFDQSCPCNQKTKTEKCALTKLNIVAGINTSMEQAYSWNDIIPYFNNSYINSDIEVANEFTISRGGPNSMNLYNSSSELCSMHSIFLQESLYYSHPEQEEEVLLSGDAQNIFEPNQHLFKRDIQSYITPLAAQKYHYAHIGITDENTNLAYGSLFDNLSSAIAPVTPESCATEFEQELGSSINSEKIKYTENGKHCGNCASDSSVEEDKDLALTIIINSQDNDSDVTYTEVNSTCDAAM